jgi:hypothetical protein
MEKPDCNHKAMRQPNKLPNAGQAREAPNFLRGAQQIILPLILRGEASFGTT